MTPESCTATVDGLAATGTDIGAGGLVAVAAFAVIAVGAALAWRHRRRVPAILGAVAILAAAAAVATSALTPATAAHAAGSLSYSEGCTLIRVDDVVAPAVVGLLPGDETTTITATVVNVTDAAVAISLSGTVDAALRDTATLTAHIDGAGSGPAELAPGSSAQVRLTLALPGGAGDIAQGRSATTSLTITAAQR